MDRELKSQVEALYQGLGTSFAEAVRIFAQQSLREGGMPFRPSMKTWNELTQEEINAKLFRSETDVAAGGCTRRMTGCHDGGAAVPWMRSGSTASSTRMLRLRTFWKRWIISFTSFKTPSMRDGWYQSLKTAVQEGLSTFPYKFQPYRVEPWESKGYRQMVTDTDVVIYTIDEETVTVTIHLVATKGRDLPRI